MEESISTLSRRNIRNGTIQHGQIRMATRDRKLGATRGTKRSKGSKALFESNTNDKS